MAVTYSATIYQSDVDKLRQYGYGEYLGRITMDWSEIAFSPGWKNTYYYKVQPGTRPMGVAPPGELWTYVGYKPPSTPTPAPAPTPVTTINPTPTISQPSTPTVVNPATTSSVNNFANQVAPATSPQTQPGVLFDQVNLMFATDKPETYLERGVEKTLGSPFQVEVRPSSVYQTPASYTSFNTPTYVGSTDKLSVVKSIAADLKAIGAYASLSEERYLEWKDAGKFDFSFTLKDPLSGQVRKFAADMRSGGTDVYEFTRDVYGYGWGLEGVEGKKAQTEYEKQLSAERNRERAVDVAATARINNLFLGEPDTKGMSKNQANVERAIAAGALPTPIDRFIGKLPEPEKMLPVSIQLPGKTPGKTEENLAFINPYGWIISTNVSTDKIQKDMLVGSVTLINEPEKMSPVSIQYPGKTEENLAFINPYGWIISTNVSTDKIQKDMLVGSVTLQPEITIIEPSKEVKQLQKAGFDYTGLSDIGKTPPSFMASPVLNKLNVSTQDIAKFGMGVQERARVGISTIFGGAEKSSNKNVAYTASFIENAVLGVGGATVGLATSIPLAAEVTGKKFLENPKGFPKFLGTGILGGALITKQQAQEDPIGFTAQVVGGALAFGTIKTTITKGYGIARTTGKEYIPIEKIGYDVREGFPVSTKITESSLARSFAKNTFDPFPEKMSITGKPPSYVPEMARLPTDVLTGKQRVMWTGWEKTPSGTRGPFGGEFVLEGGSSELQGMYGAPGAEAYFTKVGGQMPNIVGFDFSLVKRPSLVHSLVSEIKGVPKSVRSGGYPSIQEYMNKMPGGKAVMPLTKMEYEAVLPSGNVMEIAPMGGKYYTKLGGIGEGHLFGTRVPIIELVATGKRVSTTTDVSLPRFSSSYYKQSPMINLADVIYSFPKIGYRTSIKTTSIGVSTSKILGSSQTIRGVSTTSLGRSITDVYKRTQSTNYMASYEKSMFGESIPGITGKSSYKYSDSGISTRLPSYNSYVSNIYSGSPSKMYKSYQSYISSPRSSISYPYSGSSGVSRPSSGSSRGSGLSSYISRITSRSYGKTSYSSHITNVSRGYTSTSSITRPPKKTTSVFKKSKDENQLEKMLKNIGAYKFREQTNVWSVKEAMFGTKKRGRKK